MGWIGLPYPRRPRIGCQRRGSGRMPTNRPAVGPRRGRVVAGTRPVANRRGPASAPDALVFQGFVTNVGSLEQRETQSTNSTHTSKTTRAISIRSKTPPRAKDRNDSSRSASRTGGGELMEIWGGGCSGSREPVASLQPDWPLTRRGCASEWSVGSRSGSPVPPPRVARGGCERLPATRRTAWRSPMPDPVPP